MKNFNFTKTKIAILASITFCGLSLSPLSLAAVPANAPGNGIGTGAIVAAIKELGNKIEAISISTMKYVNNMTYQYDPDLPNTTQVNAGNVVTLNGEQITPSQYATLQARDTTQANINNGLAGIAYAITPPDPSSDSEQFKVYDQYVNTNSTTALTQNIKASDSPFMYSNNPDFTQAAADNPVLAKALMDARNTDEIKNNNKTFNFGNIITPTTYTSSENIAASQFSQFATQSSQPLTDGADFSKLKNVSATGLFELVTSPEFQQYQYNVRSTVATRSILSSLLNTLVAERTPNKDFCIGSGTTKTCNVSPLAVQKYMATHRTNDPQWYQAMATASPATLQREMLFTLVEIEKQNYEAHLEREQILSALILSAIQSGQANKILAAAQSSGLNNRITKVMGESDKKIQDKAKKFNNTKNN